VGDVAVGRKSDAQNVSNASHLESFQTPELANEGSPCLGAVEKGWKHRAFEDSDFGFRRDLLSGIKHGFEAPEVVRRFLKASVDLIIETWFGGEYTAKIGEGIDILNVNST
jgi:hypothetical protein